MGKTDKTGYKNFDVAVYVPVGNVNRIKTRDDFERQLGLLYDNVRIGKVYIEDFRAMEWATKEHLLEVKGFFEEKGIKVSGGITTCSGEEEGFVSFCYSDDKYIDILRRAVALNAEIFDEFIFDDFYFTNCRCKKCIEKKGSRSWAQFRMEEKNRISRDVVMKTAKEINPNVNVILKYPQWFEVYNETGYDLIEEPKIFDTIYTGTETRNPDYCAQHLPKYLSYFIMRHLESAALGRNLGGWFDPFECEYNLTSYLEQGYLTVFAKAREVTLFCLGALTMSPQYRNFPGALNQMFEELDEYMGRLGDPVGVAAYLPGRGRGEDNIHSYLGMCGIPFEPSINYPEDAEVVFLAEGAAYDDGIAEKMKKTMFSGGDVVVTTGFLRKMGDAFGEFVNVAYSSRKAIVQEYADTSANGVTIGGSYTGREPILIPQIDYCNNDIWELAAAYGRGMNYPIVLRCSYGGGHLSIITIPDNMGDLYSYPAEVLKVIRGLLCRNIKVSIEGPSGVMLFVYDNDTFIVRSDLAYAQNVTINVGEDAKAIKCLNMRDEISLRDGKAELMLIPGVNYVMEVVRAEPPRSL